MRQQTQPFLVFLKVTTHTLELSWKLYRAKSKPTTLHFLGFFLLLVVVVVVICLVLLSFLVVLRFLCRILLGFLGFLQFAQCRPTLCKSVCFGCVIRDDHIVKNGPM